MGRSNERIAVAKKALLAFEEVMIDSGVPSHLYRMAGKVKHRITLNHLFIMEAATPKSKGILEIDPVSLFV